MSKKKNGKDGSGLLGTGMARKAAEKIKKNKQNRQKRLDNIMKNFSSGRKK